MRHLRIVPDNTNFGFVRFRRFSFPISAALSILALVFFFTHGLNYGIDFKGGTLMEVRASSGQIDIGAMRTSIEGLGLGEVQLQEIGGNGEVLIRIAQQPGGDAEQQVAATKVRSTLGTGYVYERVEVIGPRVSQELVTLGTVGIFFAIGAILVYLWFRFDWQFAVGAMIANVHDLVLTIGFMSVTQIDFDLTSVAALLTILGYSLNDTVVIYDRIRELLRKYKKMPMAELLDNATNATLSRSIITHVTVTLALLALLLFGGRAIHSFTATMMFGVVLVGTYTSIFIASPILIYLGLRPGGPRPPTARTAAKSDGRRRPALPAAAAADRRLRRRRLSLRRHVASRLPARPALGHACLGRRRPRRVLRGGVRPGVRGGGGDRHPADRRRGAIPSSWRKRCAGASGSVRISVDVMTTSAAAMTWNVLLAEDRRVAAALIAVP